MNERTRKQLDALPPEKRAKAEALIARGQAPQARAARAAAMGAIEAEVRETGGITTADGVLHRVKLPPAPAVAEESAFQLVAVGRALRERRAAAGLSLDAVGRESGVDPSAVARIERGENPNPTVGTLVRVAAAVGARIAIVVEDVTAGV
jgi:DNA-binding XRE family transcriptional regulator